MIGPMTLAERLELSGILGEAIRAYDQKLAQRLVEVTRPQPGEPAVALAQRDD